MPVDLVWTPQARQDLIEIYTYIGLDNPSAAERVFDSIQSKAEMLVAHPRLGVRVRIFGPPRACSSRGPI